MTTGAKFFPLRNWLLYSDKPDEKGCLISGLKDNAPEEIKKLYKEYISLLTERE